MPMQDNKPGHWMKRNWRHFEAAAKSTMRRWYGVKEWPTGNLIERHGRLAHQAELRNIPALELQWLPLQGRMKPFVRSVAGFFPLKTPSSLGKRVFAPGASRFLCRSLPKERESVVALIMRGF